MLVPHSETFPDPEWRRRAFEALAAYPRFVADLEAESGLRIDFSLCGSIDASNGQRVEYPDEGQVDPRGVTAALAVNLEIREHVRVSEIDNAPDRVMVAGIVARAAVVAAGAWSGLLPGMPECHPVWGHLLGYDLPPGAVGPIRRAGHIYILQRVSGFTILGATEEEMGFDRTLDSAALLDLRHRGEELWPELRAYEPVDAWCGFRPATRDGTPRSGRLGKANVWLAYGHYRNGILLAPVVATMLAAEITSTLRKNASS